MNRPDQHPSSTSTDPTARVTGLSAAERVPETWDEVRDPAFFAMTARVFTPPTTLAMTVLLASYDPEPAVLGATSTGD
jgi:hypothetical protein